MIKKGLVPARSTASYPTLAEASIPRRSFLAGLAGLGAAGLLAVGIGACGHDGGAVDAWHWTDSISMGIPDAHRMPDARSDSRTDGVDATWPHPDAAPDAGPPDAGLPDGGTPDAQ